LRERERESDWRQSGRICNATGYLLQWKKIQKQLVIFVAFFRWLLRQLRFYKFFKNKNSFFTLIANLGSLGEGKTWEKEKENQDNAWSAHYFILFSIVLISKFWRFLPKF
jgi:hypothetical protein